MIIPHSPNSPKVEDGGLSDRLLGKADSALAIANRQVGRDSSSFRGWVHLGDAYIATDSLQAAQRAVRRSLALRHDAANQRLLLGHLHFRGGQYQQAATAYQQLIDLKSASLYERSHGSYFLGLALEQYRQDSTGHRQFEQYVANARKFVKAYPGRPGLRLDLARGLARVGEDGAAQRVVRQVLRDDSISGTLHFKSALVTGALGDRKKTVRHLRAAVRHGYRDLATLKLHPDLSLLHRSASFQVVLDSLRMASDS